jgi:hypothetical protein
MSNEINSPKQSHFTGKHIFAGTLFIALGLLVLINNFTTIYFDWAVIWKLWPLFIILLGISVLIKHKLGKGIISGIAALVLALAIFASFKTAFRVFHNDFEVVFGEDAPNGFDSTFYQEGFVEGITRAELNFDAAAGKFKIADSTDDLIDIMAIGLRDNYNLKRHDFDSTAQIDFVMKKTRFKFSEGHKNIAEVSLNTNPVWNIYLDMGAAAMEMDLTNYKIDNIDIDMGAASLEIRLGELNRQTNLSIDAGASDIDIFVPKNSGCKIQTDVALTSKDFDDFEKIKSDLYATENFDEANNKIYIEVDSGVSSISVKRY